MFTLKHIKNIFEIPLNQEDDQLVIDSIAYDTRKIVNGERVIFLCLKGSNRDGHDYLEDAYNKGVRVAMVSENDLPDLPGMHFLRVPDVLKSLHQWARQHRSSREQTTVLGITGSNAKTIIKEWIFQICHPEISVIRSPKSYNSQIGVALSLLQIKDDHTIGIIEAGISTIDEMAKIESIIKPDLGIFTNIGQAHAGGFKNTEEKIREKAILFKDCPTIIVNSNHSNVFNHLLHEYGRERLRTWGTSPENDYIISKIDDQVILKWDSGEITVPVLIRDHFHLENIAHTIVACLELGIDTDIIIQKTPYLTSLDMRLEHIQGRSGSIIINDAYVTDITSLKVALEHVSNLNHSGPLTLILSDIHGLKQEDGDYNIIGELIQPLKPYRLITIGSDSESIHADCKHFHFPETLDLMNQLDTFTWDNHLILLKGARKYQLEGLVSKLERSSHSAVLEINLPALHHNITKIKEQIQQGVGFIPVLKASAYGTGIEKIAASVASHQPAFIAVAYNDEGIRLRQYGIEQRIIVLNPDPDKADLLFNYNLEPEVHDLEMLVNYASKAESLMTTLNIHLKLDTGMHRMGFLEKDLGELISLLRKHPSLYVSTIFSHLSSSEDPEHDSYTRMQARRFKEWADLIADSLGYRPGLHLLNSEGIWRFPEFQFDYIRAGITLYGISTINRSLKKVHALRGKVLSIKDFPKGSDIGYGRSQTLKKDATLAVINIGYADGLMRSGSNGNIEVLINGKSCPVVGRICMDVTMVDVSHVPGIKTGDSVEIFGSQNDISQLADKLHTIPYEILCRISSRIVRKYIVD